MFINIILIIIIFLIIYLIINNTKTIKGGKPKKKNKKKKKKQKKSKIPVQFISFGGNESIKDESKLTKCYNLYNECLDNNPQNPELCDINQCILKDVKNNKIKSIKSKKNNKKQNIIDADKYTQCFKLHNECLNNNPQNKEKCDLRQCILQENINKKNKMKEIKSKFEIQVDEDNQEYYNQLLQNININQEYLYEPHDKNKYDIYKSL